MRVSTQWAVEHRAIEEGGRAARGGCRRFIRRHDKAGRGREITANPRAMMPVPRPACSTSRCEVVRRQLQDPARMAVPTHAARLIGLRGFVYLNRN
jgi:hypothetical protein